jgi:hypothetical protein
MTQTQKRALAQRAAGVLATHAPQLLRDKHALDFDRRWGFSAMVQHELHWLVMTPAERAAHEVEELRKRQKRQARREATLWAPR